MVIVALMKNATVAQSANVLAVQKMKIKEVVDYFYGLDPAHLSYTHKIGDVYGKKNLKIPHAKLHKKKNKFKNEAQKLG